MLLTTAFLISWSEARSAERIPPAASEAEGGARPTICGSSDATALTGQASGWATLSLSDRSAGSVASGSRGLRDEEGVGANGAGVDAAPAADDAEGEWTFGASVYAYFVPEDDDYLQPTVMADHDWLHLEARYNYEGPSTGSIWAGYNLSWTGAVSGDFTPILGGVFGDTEGVAPGYELSVTYWKLELYSEGEYLFDTSGSSDDFFYNWSQLTLSPVDWFQFGFAAQRTRTYDTGLDIQRGLLVGFTYKALTLQTIVFNLDQSAQTVVVSLSAEF